MQTKKPFGFIFFILLSLVIFKSASGQENYVTGLVITQQGDTLHGFIDFRNWGSNPDKISFKETENAVVTTYNPATIKGFKVQNELYLSAVVQAEISSDQTNEMDYNNELKIRIDTTFLQALYLGPKSLYYYNDKYGKRNFYIKEWPDFELLVYKIYLKENAKKSYGETENAISENKKFIGQLLLYLQDCQGIQSKINIAEYNRNSLESIFKAYYKCSQSTVSYTSAKEKPVLKFGALAGLSVTNLNLTTDVTDSFKPYSNTEYKPSYNFSGGIYMDILMQRNLRKWSINNELLYSAYKATSHVEDISSEEKYSIYDITIGYSYFKLNCMLRYTIPLKNDVFIYFNSGVSYGYAISETNSLVTETKFYSTPKTTYDIAIKETRKSEQGFLAGLGSRYKKYSFETRYERGNGMSVYSALSSKTNRFYFLLGYRF